jgi:hypothetical protein
VGWHTSQRLACSGSEEYQSREQSGAEVRDGGSGGSRREQHITGGGFEATELLVDLEEEGHERSREEEEEGGGVTWMQWTHTSTVPSLFRRGRCTVPSASEIGGLASPTCEYCASSRSISRA